MRRNGSRRGVAVAAVVAVLAALHLAILCSIGGSRDEAEIAELRVQSARAFLAAESAALAAAALLAAGEAPPEPGSSLVLGAAEGVYVDAPESDKAGEIVAEGRAGRARRRIVVLMQ